MAEQIEVFIRPSQTFNGLGNHMWAVYTNAAGQQFSMSGWSNTRAELFSGWGTLDTQVTEWGPKSWDWEARNTFIARDVVATGANLSSAWNSMTQCATAIDNANLRYAPLGVNSNSVINTCLLWAGIPPVDIDSENNLFGIWTPGGNTDLRSQISGAPKGADEVNPLTANLNFYIPIFGFGGTGEQYFASGRQFGVTDLYTAPAGKWVYSVVSVVGSPAPSGKWTWVSSTDVKLKPVILDLDGDGLELVSAEAGPGFDIFASGEPTPTGWFVGGDGALVFDANGNGVVDDVTELSFLHHSPGSTTDLQALAAFDGNANGWLDAGDSNYSLFRIWRDLNVNGVSDAGELVSLAAADVQSISLSGGGGQYDVQSNRVYAASTFTRVSGGTGTAFDVGLQAFSRGSKQVGSDANWAVMEIETGQRVAVAQPGATAVNIANLGTHTVLGAAVQGYQLSNGNDAVTLAAGWGSKRLYIDGGDGNDTINLGTSTVENNIKGGVGEDYITAGTGNDWIAPGQTGGFGDSIVDFGGDEHYVVERGAFAYIDDRGGRDVLLMTGFNSSELQFFRFASSEFLDSIYVAGENTGVHLLGMGTGQASQGIEFLVTKDRTFNRSEIEALAGPLSFSMEETTTDLMGMATMPRVLEDWVALP